jgi:tetratricopeptide (TPR) repeat protein
VLDWWPLGRVRAGAPWPRLLIFEKLPIVVLSAAFALKAVAAQSSTGALASLEALSIADRIGSALRGGIWYLGKFVLPTGLGVLYPLSLENVPLWRTAAAASLLAFVSVVAVLVRRRRPQALAGWLWFVLTLLPVSGLVQTGSHSVADRFAYVPIVGLLAMVTAFLAGPGAEAMKPRLLGAAVASLVVALSAASCMQARSWRNELTLFNQALAVGGGESPIVRNHLAEASERAGDYSGAVRHHQVALRLRPDWAMTYRGLGRVLARQGDLDAAERHLREAVRLDPGNAEVVADLEDLLRCREEPATVAACLERTIVARADDKWR